MTQLMLQEELPRFMEGEGRPKRCPKCNRSSSEVTLVAPRKLPYEEAKRYSGPMFCLEHAPRFNDGAELDLVGKL